MKITHEPYKKSEIEYPCLMELNHGSSNNPVPTGLVVLMMKPGEGMIVSLKDGKHKNGSYHEGYWGKRWHKNTDPDMNYSHWVPWSGSVTLEND